MTDESHFRIDLPSVLCTIGSADRVNIWRSSEMDESHPALQFARLYAEQRGLVAMAIDVPYNDDRFYVGCLASVYVKPADRMKLLEEIKA